MSRWAPWIADAVTPRPDEIARVGEALPPDVRDALARDTAPTRAEVERLLASRRAPEPGRGRLAWGGALLTAGLAAGLLAVWVAPEGYGPVPVPVGEVHALVAPLSLGPSIDVTGRGTLRVDQADEQGTIVSLLDGRATFDVDPEGRHRDLRVRAGEVEVEVVGTVFDVAHGADGVRVDVSRGRVVVRHGGVEARVAAGDSWAVPMVAAVVPAPVPDAVVSDGDVTEEQGARETGAPEADRPAASEAAAGDAREPAADAVPDGVADPAPIEAAPTEPGTDDAAPTDTAPNEPTGVASPSAGGSAPVQAPPAPEPPAPERVAWHEIQRAKAGGVGADALLDALDAFVDAHGDTSYGAPARLLRLHTLAAHRPSADLVREIDAYLADTPRPRQRTELLWLRAEVARDGLGDCALALSSYRRLVDLVHATDPRAGEAQAWRGLCAADLGHEREALEALQRAIVLGVASEDLLDRVVGALEELNGRRRR